MNDKVQRKNIKNHLRAMLIFIVGLYLPFFIVLNIKFDAVNISLSGLGWREGEPIFLLSFIVLTVPFMFYQTYIFIKSIGRKNKRLLVISAVGGLLMTVGAAIPCRDFDAHIFHLLHTFCCMSGAGILILSVTYMIAQYCMHNKEKTKKVAVLYGIFATVILMGFLVLRTAALFEAGSSLCFMVVLFLLNKALSTKEIEPQNFEQETDCLELTQTTM